MWFQPHLLEVSADFPVLISVIIRFSIELHNAAYGFSFTACCRANIDPKYTLLGLDSSTYSCSPLIVHHKYNQFIKKSQWVDQEIVVIKST